MNDIKKFASGEFLMRQGDVPDFMYALLSGQVKVFRQEGDQEIELGTLGPDSYVGEMELIDGKPRLASAVALEETRCTVISKEEFAQRFNEIDPVFQEILSREVTILRNDRELYLKNIRTSVIVNRKTALAEIGKPREFEKGAVILAQGDCSNKMYLINSGLVDVSRYTEGQRIQLGQYGRNAILGELSMVDGRPHSATVTALEKTQTTEIDCDELRDKFNNLGFFRSVLTTLVGSIRTNHEIYGRLQGAQAKA